MLQYGPIDGILIQYLSDVCGILLFLVFFSLPYHMKFGTGQLLYIMPTAFTDR